MSNYYDLLEIPRTASQNDVRKSYRRLARQYHPDVNKGDKASEEKFKAINEAYGVLSDADKRRKYDRYGDNWEHAPQIDENAARRQQEPTFHWSTDMRSQPDVDFDNDPGGILDGLFRNMRNHTRQAAPTEYTAEVTLEEAYLGTARVVELADGRRLEVKIPPGVDSGSRIRISPDGRSSRDLYLVVSVKEHPRFQRLERDLYTEVEASLEDAVLGTDLTVQTLTGRLALTIPAETQNGRRFRLAGQGMPSLNNPKSRGDLFATVKVRLPTGLSDEEKGLIRRFRDIRSQRGGQP